VLPRELRTREERFVPPSAGVSTDGEAVSSGWLA
jgi:hypothetical protein